MPDLDTDLHLTMHRRWRQRHRSLVFRVARAVRREIARKPTYGSQWGDPETVPPLKYTKERFLDPYVSPDSVALEIGPGGGRWTQYLLGVQHLYLVEYYQPLLDEIKQAINARNVTFIKNHGTDFPGIPESCIDYIFSFGVFVHLDQPRIKQYLENMRPILKADGNIVLKYSDKNKDMAQINKSFSENTPEAMREMVRGAGYDIAEEDTTTMWHSAVMRLKKTA